MYIVFLMISGIKLTSQYGLEMVSHWVSFIGMVISQTVHALAAILDWRPFLVKIVIV